MTAIAPIICIAS